MKGITYDLAAKSRTHKLHVVQRQDRWDGIAVCGMSDNGMSTEREGMSALAVWRFTRPDAEGGTREDVCARCVGWVDRWY